MHKLMADGKEIMYRRQQTPFTCTFACYSVCVSTLMDEDISERDLIEATKSGVNARILPNTYFPSVPPVMAEKHTERLLKLENRQRWFVSDMIGKALAANVPALDTANEYLFKQKEYALNQELTPQYREELVRQIEDLRKQIEQDPSLKDAVSAYDTGMRDCVSLFGKCSFDVQNTEVVKRNELPEAIDTVSEGCVYVYERRLPFEYSLRHLLLPGEMAVAGISRTSLDFDSSTHHVMVVYATTDKDVYALDTNPVHGRSENLVFDIKKFYDAMSDKRILIFSKR